ncbi:alpha/beta fold hydrolase [Xanthomarina sp. F2636L]|uniref:alpha/beta fold hydrolase n=1 Tax=Xanthomarina sp. F2636L TaxID=2996018 RepID=UPI00225E67BB|nr:alpha/beta hydrolase [Xanthomarina sp. F2636L]MCX7550179.1 alpha/beta hydrolase [Xanthomarina sp. F2636L]
MSQDIIHVYFVPGMAAGPSIFENIKLPENQFEMHMLEWLIPSKNETIEHYSRRMVELIKHDNVVLIGVSFGGIMVQEMSKHLTLKKLIVVSSVKTKHEFSKRMKIAKITKAYKIMPTSLVNNIDALAKYTFGNTIKKRVALYRKYLSVTNKDYLDWAIEQVICWDQDKPNPNAIHIHGENDMVFPHRCLGDCITVKGGTHIMIIDRYKWFNENLPKLILDEDLA